MKKLICIFFCLLILTAPAFAVEYLQMDAADDDGVLYYSSSGKIVPKSHDFTLYALVDLDAKKDALDATYYISAALIPKFSETPPDDFDYGSFTFNGISYEVNFSNIDSRSDEGLKPNSLGGDTGVLRDDSNLTTFDSYTFYFEYSFSFFTDENGTIGALYSEGGTPWDVGEVNAYETISRSPGDPSKTLAYAAFDINTTMLDFFDVRFDLYTLNSSGNIQFTSATTHYVQTAPEPGTMLLFGFGLIWMARMGRKKLL